VGRPTSAHRGFGRNFGLGLWMQGRELASGWEASLLDDLAHCREITADRPAAAFPRRLGEACARLLSPLL